MANTLTSLIPDLYEALDIVSREMVGFIPAVTLDASAERAALNQAIRIPITPAAPAEDVTPGQLPPDDGDQAIGNTPLTITKSRTVPFRWTGEEQHGVDTGPGYANIRRDQITQAFRTLANEIDAFIWSTASVAASRAYGTAGTSPFASDLSDPANVLKILKDNGAPTSDLQLVIDTTAGAKVRSLAQLTKANEAGTVALRERGILLDIHGFKLRESAGVGIHAVGTGASYVTNGALAVGATAIAVQTGTGTILAGDVISFGDGFKYVVASALSGGTVTIAAPGLRKAVTTGTTVTIASAFTANMAFSRSSIILATRAPALPREGDMAEDRVMIQDPVSGLAFEVAMYMQYRRVRYEVSIAYGAANIKPAHTALLLG